MSSFSAPQRVCALIDMDCFYCAVERFLAPELVGLPMAVLQYNPYEHNKSGGRGEGSVQVAQIE